MRNELNNYFSIIIPLYNKEEYIERAIKSILNQTYQNFEIIIVNDGSNDGGEKKAASFDDKRIKVINQQNQGVSSARNTGANIANYEFLAFLDADDIWLNTFLEEVNMLIDKYPNAGIYGTNNYFEYPNGKITFEKYDWLFRGEKSGIIDDYFAIFVKVGKSPFSNSNICIPKQTYKDFGGYMSGVRLTEDSDLWCRIALKNDIVFLTTPLAYYYLGTTGHTHFLFEPKDFQVTITLKNMLNNELIKPRQIRSINKLIAFHQLNLIKRSILTGHRLFALKKIIKSNLICYFPFDIIKCLIVLLIPSNIVINQRKKKFF